ncbi:MAG: ribonuclease HII [Candidatus Phosphoribacter sp.]
MLAGMDEVGRGALAGPVSVGVVVISEACRSAPQGLRDSKLLTPDARARLVPRIQRWAFAYAVGHASAAEIDAVGIMRALRLAGVRALAALPIVPDLVILDGNHDWLTAPEHVGLLAFAESDPCPGAPELTPAVTTMIKADRRCSSVAAASVLAKVERDTLMVGLAGGHPAYRWEVNKGYAAPEHRAALEHVGPCELHRLTWRLRVPGDAVVERDDGTRPEDEVGDERPPSLMTDPTTTGKSR